MLYLRNAGFSIQVEIIKSGVGYLQTKFGSFEAQNVRYISYSNTLQKYINHM